MQQLKRDFKYYKLNFNLYETHRLVFDIIKPREKVLDVGCATGYIARELLKKKCIVWGIDNNEEALMQAKNYCERVFLKDLEGVQQLVTPKTFFDTILILDVIEHLKNPNILLSNIKNYINDKGRFIISTPNIAHLSTRLMLLGGRFKYTKEGLMDETHLHFYTRNTFQELLTNNGLNILEIIPSNGISQVPLIHKFTDKLPLKWQYIITKALPDFFAYQFIAICN